MSSIWGTWPQGLDSSGLWIPGLSTPHITQDRDNEDFAILYPHRGQTAGDQQAWEEVAFPSRLTLHVHGVLQHGLARRAAGHAAVQAPGGLPWALQPQRTIRLQPCPVALGQRQPLMLPGHGGGREAPGSTLQCQGPAGHGLYHIRPSAGTLDGGSDWGRQVYSGPSSLPQISPALQGLSAILSAPLPRCPSSWSPAAPPAPFIFALSPQNASWPRVSRTLHRGSRVWLWESLTQPAVAKGTGVDWCPESTAAKLDRELSSCPLGGTIVRESREIEA